MRSRKILILAAVLIISGLAIIFQQINLQQTQVLSVSESEDILSVSNTATASALPNNFQKAYVDRVIDGDTIEVEFADDAGASEQAKLRYIGMDTPETVDPKRPVGCYGKEASDENKKLVDGKEVYLEKDVSETDKYGRLLRFVYLTDGSGNLYMINDFLVKNGYAKVLTIPPDVKYSDKFLISEHQAQNQKLGLWSSC